MVFRTYVESVTEETSKPDWHRLNEEFYSGDPAGYFSLPTLRNFAKFKEQVAVLARSTWPTHYVEALPKVFLGAGGADPATSAAAERAIPRLIRHVAGRLLEDLNLYNSVKHGMAVIGSRDAYVSIAEDGAAPFMGSKGPSVAFMESQVEGDRRIWSVTRRWTSIRQAMWLSQLALMEIDALWAVGRARYLGVELKGVLVVTEEAVVDGITGWVFADAGGITRFSTKVAEEILPASRKRATP